MSESKNRLLLEVCIGSIADAEAAMAAGADRLELCAALELGGLTPSLGLVEEVLTISDVPVVAMIRPRAGGFRYDRHEFAAMLRDADRFLAAGVSGVVFGVLDRQGHIDEAQTRELVERAGSRESIFHRAFDFTPDMPAALETLCGLGVTRVLNSGGKPTALAGAAMLADLVQRAAGRIEIMAGGGVSAANVGQIVQTAGVRQIHIGASGPADDGSIGPAAAINLCDQRFFQGTAYRAVAQELAAATAVAMRKL